jgi:hypothetical protein
MENEYISGETDGQQDDFINLLTIIRRRIYRQTPR